MAFRRNVRCALWAALFGALVLFSGSVSADGDDDHSPVECKLEGEINREEDRATLEAGVGGEDNIVLSALKEADGNVEEELMNHIDIGFLISVLGPLFLAIIVLLVWFFCCWTCCPFCKCCRVGARQREPNNICKIVVAVLGGGLVLGVVIAAIYGISGYDKSVDGFNSMVCTSKNTVNTIVYGNEDPEFIGINPIVTKLTAISDSLGPDADFMTEVNRIIDDTSGLTDAVDGMSSSLNLLNAVMTTDFPADVGTNLHSCKYCTVVGESAQTASDQLATGFAKSVSDARKEVKSQLNAEKSAELQKVVQDAIEPLTELQDMVENAFGENVQNTMKDISDILEKEGKLGVSVLIILALTLAFSMCIVFLWYIFKQGPITNPSYVTHRMAACTWCCGFFYAFLALWISGLLTLANVPLCGLCLIMDDLNEDLLNEIRPSLIKDSDPAEEASIDQAIDLVSQCFVPTDPDANPKLLDIITYTDDAGLPQPVRKRIVDDTVDKINEQFDLITGQPSDSLEDDETMSSFVQMLSNNDVSLLIVPVDNLCIDYPAYQPMCSNSDLFGAAVPCGVSCQSGTPQDVPGFDSTIGGIDAFVTQLETFGTNINDDLQGCADTVACDPTADVNACESGNEYVTLKRNIRALTNFRCDVWEDPADSSQPCDVKDMTGTTVDGKTTWTNTCQNSEGVMTPKQVDCDIDAFDTYVKEWGTRITKLSQRVDKAAEEVGPEIVSALKTAVDTYLIDPLLSIVNLMTCGFFAVVYDEVIDSLCFKGVVGFKQLSDSYVACGVLAFIMTVLLYVVWRHTIDNVNAAKAEDKSSS